MRMNRSKAVQLPKCSGQQLEELIAQRNFAQLVEIKLKRMFPDSRSRSDVVQLLSDYGDEKPEVHRVKLAILKLSGVDVKKIQQGVGGAIEDYEDAIAWAESPRRMKCSIGNRKLRDNECEQLTTEDRKEFENWLRQEAAA